MDMTVVIVVTLLFAAVFAIAEVWWRWHKPPVEYTRKFLHLTCGLICLPLAWLIKNPQTMVLLGVGFLGILTMTKRYGLLLCMHGVERESHGAALYPVSVLITFLIAYTTGHPEFYFVSLLVLAMSDSAASLVGMSYGRHQFLVEDGRRSLEGSVVFFLTTFTIVHVSLVLLTDLGSVECMLCAVYVAGLVTCIELLSLSGADNLLIPIGTMAILLKITTKDVDEMVWQVGLMVLDFTIVAVLVRRQNNLAASAVVALGLLTYATHALIGLSWAYLLFLCTALYGISREPGNKTEGVYRVRFIFFATINLTIWVLLTNYLAIDHHIAFLAFAVNAVAALQLVLEHSCAGRRISRYRLGLLLAIVLGVWHHMLDPNAIWWFDIVGLYGGSLALVTIGSWSLEGQGNLIQLTQRCALIGAALSLLLLAISWRFYASVL
jgi:phytol kinase